MRRHRSERWGFAVDVPARWDAYPTDATNSPFEVARFWSRESGSHNLLVFKVPRDPSDSVDAVLEGTAANLADQGYGNFSRGHLAVGPDLIPFLEFDRQGDGWFWSVREYFFPSETAYYVLGLGTTDREAMVEVWNLAGMGFEILDSPPSRPGRTDHVAPNASPSKAGRVAGGAARPKAGSPRPRRSSRPLHQAWTQLVQRFVPLLILALASAATASSAQGIAAVGELAGHGTMSMLGHIAVAGGVANPLGFKESTPRVTGLPPPRFDPAIEYSNGLTDLEFGCLMQAREDLRHVVMVQPKNARAWFLMGVAYNSMGDRAAAAGAYQEALRADPKMIDAQRELAVTLALQGQAVAGLSAILAALKAAAANCGDCADASLLKSSVTRAEAALSGQLKDAMQPEAAPAVCSALTTTAARNCFAAAKFGDPHGDGVDACTTAIGGGLPDAVKSRVLVDRGVIYLFHTPAPGDRRLRQGDTRRWMERSAGAFTFNRGAAPLFDRSSSIWRKPTSTRNRPREPQAAISTTHAATLDPTY